MLIVSRKRQINSDSSESYKGNRPSGEMEMGRTRQVRLDSHSEKLTFEESLDRQKKGLLGKHVAGQVFQVEVAYVQRPHDQ